MLEKHPKGSEMSDVASDPAFARNIIDEAFDIKRIGRSRAITMAFDALKEIERKLARIAPEALRQRPRQWTERRVRSIVDREALRIDHYEIEDLKRVRLQEARHELSRSAARAANLASFLAAADPDFHGPDIGGQVAMARTMAGAGDSGPAAGEDFDRAETDLARQRTGRVGGAGNSGDRRD